MSSSTGGVCFLLAFVAVSHALSIPNDDNILTPPSEDIPRVALSIAPTHLTPTYLNEVLLGLSVEPINPSESWSISVGKLAQAAKKFALVQLAARGMTLEQATEGSNQDYPYFGFMPVLVGKIRPTASPLTWTGHCFRSVVISVSAVANGTSEVDVTITTKEPISLMCTEMFIIGTVLQFGVEEIVMHGSKTVKWDFSKASDGDLWDVINNGVRVYSVLTNIKDTLASVALTAELFEPCATKAVQEFAAAKNVDFLQKYRGIPMTKRSVTDVVLNETEINSGDFIGVMRLDGLDPMLAWAMGATTGHTTIALWGDDGQLYICESTATSSYWDVNGIQKTPYREWIAKAKAASFNVFHLPLAPKYRAVFNATAAWEWFGTVEGLDYGYNNMFWGWIDTVQLNYPCVPPDYERCLSWDIIEVIFPLIGRVVPKFNSFFDQAFNKRLGTVGLDFGSVLREAAAQGLEAQKLPTIVEDDKWVYNLTRNGQVSSGQSMVCCVFVCHTWKAAGLFGDFADQVNCGELTNWDDYAMQLYDADYVRPQECVAADPNNTVCQMLGEFTLTAEATYNTKAPFAHIAENCPGVAPDYSRPANC